MENTILKNQNINNTVNYVYEPSKLEQLMIVALIDIEKFIEKNNFHLTEKGKEDFKKLIHSDWKSMLGNSSKRSRKRFNKYLLKFRKRQSLHSANLLLHIIHKSVLKYGPSKKIEEVRTNWMGKEFQYLKTVPEVDKVKIKVSLKEQEIQKKRKLWIKTRNEAEKLLSEYKEEKGDFYKTI